MATASATTGRLSAVETRPRPKQRPRLFDKIDRGTTEHRLARDKPKMSPSLRYPQIEYGQPKSNISLIVSILRSISMACVRRSSLTISLANG